MIIINSYSIGFNITNERDKERWFIENTSDIESYNRYHISNCTDDYVWYSKTEQFTTDDKILPKDWNIFQ